MTRQRLFAPAFPDPEWFVGLRKAVAADAELALIGRWCTLDLAIAVDDEMILLRLERGKIADIIYEPDISASWSVTLRGALHDWVTFLQPIPPPFYSDLLAMNSRSPSFSIEGDRKAFVQHLRSLARVFRIAQEVGGGHA